MQESLIISNLKVKSNVGFNPQIKIIFINKKKRYEKHSIYFGSFCFESFQTFITNLRKPI